MFFNIFNYVYQTLGFWCPPGRPANAARAVGLEQFHPAAEDDAHVWIIQRRETTNLVMKSILVPANLHIQNLLEFLEKCEQELESKSEVNSLNQLSLLSQGNTFNTQIRKQD